MRNCCQKCRPRCGGFNHGGGCGSDVETIVEPTVHCHVPHRHHHKRVRHIVPIVYHQEHHHHKHHEYEVKRKQTHSHHHHEHGRFNGDWCDTDRGGCGQGQGRGQGLGQAENFEHGEFDHGCESEMFMQ